MPPWLAELTVGQVVALVVFISGVGIGGWKLFQFIRPAVKGVTDISTDLRGEPERRDASGAVIEEARPGLMARTAATEEAQDAMRRTQEQMQQTLASLVPLVERIHHETTPNHGGSMKDAVARIEADGKATRADLAEHIGIAKKDGQRLAAVEAQLNDKEG